MKNINLDEKTKDMSLGQNFMDSDLSTYQSKFNPLGVDRGGRAVSPGIEGAVEGMSTMASNQVDLGTQSNISMGSEQALDNTAVPNPPVLGQVPSTVPELEQDKK